MAGITDENILFLMSSPRSGSTLLASILGSHSLIHSPPETWLLLPLSSLNSWRELSFTHYDHGLARIAWDQWVDEQISSSACREFAKSVYSSILKKSHKQILVEKTPRYYHIADWIESLFPRAKKIWLRRFPLDVISSCIDTWGFSLDEILGRKLSPLSYDYTISFPLLSSFFDNEQENKITINYEDLVLDTENLISNMCGELGVQFEDAMLKYFDNQEVMTNLTQSVVGDKQILDRTTIHRRSINRWKISLSANEVKKIVNSLGIKVFIRMGYLDSLLHALEYYDLNVEDFSEEGDLPRLLELQQKKITLMKESAAIAINSTSAVSDSKSKIQKLKDFISFSRAYFT